MNQLSENLEIFLNKTRVDTSNVTAMIPDASGRKYFRVRKNGQSYVVMDSSDSMDSLADFVRISEYLRRNSFSSPIIYESDMDHGYLLLEDLGPYTIDHLLINNYIDLESTYFNLIDLIGALSDLSDPPIPEFDRVFFMSELSIFTNNYLKYSKVVINDQTIDEFQNVWLNVLNYLEEIEEKHVFVHKDLHVRNLFWLPDRPANEKFGIIDFQSAKKGSIVYDLTSVLYDCRFPIPQPLRNKLSEKLRVQKGIDRAKFQNLMDIYIAQRNIKILGNFTGFYINQNNSHYLKYLPSVWTNVSLSLKNPILTEVKLWFDKYEIKPIN